MERIRARLGWTLVGLLMHAGGPGSVATSAQEATPDASPIALGPVEFVWEIGSDLFERPVDVTVGPDGAVWVVDGPANQIVILAPSGEVIDTFGEPGTGDGQFQFGEYDAAVVVDGDGTIYVLDVGNNRVQVFDPDRQFVTAWGGAGTGDGQFVAAADLTVDAEGNIYVLDIERQDVQKFSPDGTFLLRFGSTGPNSQFGGPTRIGADAAGNIYVPDQDRVEVFDAEGNILRAFGSFTYAIDVAVDANGTIFVSDGEAHRVQVFDKDGAFLAEWGTRGSSPGQFAYPGAVAVDGEGNTYVLDFDNERVQKFRLLPPLAPEGAGTPTP